MKKRIGIVTFFDESNYGAVLQAYALYTMLSKQGYDPSFIRFYKEERIVEKTQAQLALFKKYPRLEEKEKEMLGYKAERDDNFIRFVEHYLTVDSTLYTKEDYAVLNDNYDVFLVGSDQVWNYQIIDMNPVYFLDFADKNKKYSYAASFGVNEVPRQYKADYGKWLSEFRLLSVRELSGADIVKKLIGREACVHIDPVMLLSAGEWDKIADTYKHEKPYVLLYALEYNAKMVEYASDIARDKGIELVIVSGGYWIPLGADCWCKWSVNAFVSLIKNADTVITNSFHGLAFSLIYHKNIKLYVLNELEKRNCRLTNLLAIMGIEDLKQIDWESVDYNILKQKEISLKYLEDIGKND